MSDDAGKGTRKPNGASTIYYSEYDGCWHGRVTVGVRNNGAPDRRHIKRKAGGEGDKKAYNAVRDAVRKLEQERDTGTVRKAGRAMLVEEWLVHWLENIARPTLKYKAYRAYRTAVHHHLIPGVGKHRMDHRLRPEHFERLYAAILKAGASPGTAHQVHRTARTAFREAHRREVITRNPLALVKAPRLNEEEVAPFDVDEIQRLIKTALGRRNGVRFVLALALGTRQGETIGLKWSRLNDKTKLLTIASQLQRQTWEHGCDDPHACSAKHHKVKPCPKGCSRHTRPCPPPCPPDCTSHARRCPLRRGGGMVEEEVKSRAGRRGIVLPDQLYTLLMDHKAAQEREREHAADLWADEGWMFAQPTGRPLDPRRDLAEWKALLAEAGVRDARLHDARHTAATVLLLLEVPERAVMEFMGWSNSGMTKRYQHITAVLRASIAKRLDSFLWNDD
jgi:integrase